MTVTPTLHGCNCSFFITIRRNPLECTEVVSCLERAGVPGRQCIHSIRTKTAMRHVTVPQIKRVRKTTGSCGRWTRMRSVGHLVLVACLSLARKCPAGAQHLLPYPTHQAHHACRARASNSVEIGAVFGNVPHPLDGVVIRLFYDFEEANVQARCR